MNNLKTEMTRELAQVALSQISKWDLLAISGGRMRLTGDALVLPVAHGYTVEISYNHGTDYWLVQRVLTRGHKRFVKGERHDVGCDELSEAAYRASCFHDEF